MGAVQSLLINFMRILQQLYEAVLEAIDFHIDDASPNHPKASVYAVASPPMAYKEKSRYVLKKGQSGYARASSRHTRSCIHLDISILGWKDLAFARRRLSVTRSQICTKILRIILAFGYPSPRQFIRQDMHLPHICLEKVTLLENGLNLRYVLGTYPKAAEIFNEVFTWSWYNV